MTADSENTDGRLGAGMVDIVDKVKEAFKVYREDGDLCGFARTMLNLQEGTTGGELAEMAAAIGEERNNPQEWCIRGKAKLVGDLQNAIWDELEGKSNPGGVCGCGNFDPGDDSCYIYLDGVQYCLNCGGEIGEES